MPVARDYEPTVPSARRLVAERQVDRVRARGKRERGGTEFKLFLVHPNGTGQRRLTARSILNPSWSPDGKRIVFDDGRDLYVLRVDGSGVRRLTKTGAGATDPAWSPDGAQIAYVRARSSAPFTSGDVWIVNASGSHARLVIRHATQPAWKGG
jgi:Tol biopolymer transport system component